MSLWDIHRTQLPWLSLTQPTRFRDILSSLQHMAQQGSGDIPKWPLLNTYTGCMIGSHAWVTFAEAVLKHQTEGLNMSYVYQSMYKGATETRPHSGRISVYNYTELGYVPSELAKQSASLTLAYAFDDHALSVVARLVGQDHQSDIFYNRSRAAYKHLWSQNRQLLCAKSSKTQKITCPLDPALPYPVETMYTEGDALQWLWFVPHDPYGLVALFPTNQSFVNKLHAFIYDAMTIKEGGKWAGKNQNPFTKTWPILVRVLSDRVLLFLFCSVLVYVWNLIATGGTVLANAWYWAGNEPNILSPWMFGFAGHQYQNYTNYWTRWLVDNAYGTTGTNGLPGNDDFGTLSTWLTWSMLGIYPLAGTQRFVIGAPRFASVCIARSSISSSSGGSSSDAMGDFCVIGHNVNRGNTFTHISKCELNGAVLDEPMFDWNKISHTSSPSTLEIWMSETPGQWG